MAGFEAFTPMFGAVLLAAIGIALGFVALFLPGVYLRGPLVLRAAGGGDRGRARSGRAQALERARPGLLVAHASASWCWRTWRSAIPGLLLLAPFNAIADEHRPGGLGARRHDPRHVGDHCPFVALYSTLLYYDLLARRTPLAY